MSDNAHPPLDLSHDSVWSCTANVMRWPRRLRAEAVTGSINPPPGRLMRVRPVSGTSAEKSPNSIMGNSARQMLSVWSSETAVT